MPPIIILPLALMQGTAPPVMTVPPPPAPPVVRSYPVPPSPPPAPPPSSDAQAAKPRGNPGSWATSSDYPSRALRELQEGRTSFRLIVGRDGRATHCEIRESSGWPTLDTATCSMVTRRARFTPATNRRGEPTEGSYSSAVRWQIPDDDNYPEPGQTGRSFVIEADGSVTDCRDWDVAQAAPGYGSQCNGAVFYTPHRDKKGKPARRQITITTQTSVTDAE